MNQIFRTTLLLVAVATAFVSLLASCASKQDSSILVERGIPVEERTYDITQEGYGIDNRIKGVFKDGYVVEGMNSNLVMLLWGTPNKELSCGFNDYLDREICTVWEYYNVKTGDLITRLKFQVDSSYKGVDWTNAVKVVTIEGDRYGGSPPPPASVDEGVY
jgi:hypothetical protein